MKSKKPLLSVVIPTYNEEKDISDCIQSLLVQTYPRVEIIVVDDGSSDKTREIIKRFKKVRLIEGEHRGPGFSRNKGARLARGEILVFVDADMFFDKTYLENLTRPIREGSTLGTEEKTQIASNPENIWSKCWGSYAKENAGNLGHIFRALLKSKFFEWGGFDPKYGYADDMTFYFKFNARSTIASDAFCYHKNPETLRDVYKQSRWIGASLGNNWKILSIPVLSHLTALALIPLSIIAIPLIALGKVIKRSHYKYFFHYLVFYTVRYYGSLEGIFRKILMNKNTR